MGPKYSYQFKFHFSYETYDGEKKCKILERYPEDSQTILDQIKAYNKIKLELAKTYGEVNWALVRDFVKRPVLAWSLEHRLLEPVKDYVEDCTKLVTYWGNTDLNGDNIDLTHVEFIIQTTLYEESIINIPKTSEENKICKT